MIGLAIMAKRLAFRRSGRLNVPYTMAAQAFMYRGCECGVCEHYFRIIDRITQGKKP